MYIIHTLSLAFHVHKIRKLETLSITTATTTTTTNLIRLQILFALNIHVENISED